MKRNDRILKPFLATVSLAALLAFSLPYGGATAMEADDDLKLSGVALLSDGDMDALRGGFFDPTGLIFRFAVDVQTQIDGMVKFVRSIVMMPDVKGNLVATANAELQTANLPSGTVASVVDDGRGVVVADSKGTTAALNQTEQGALASIIVNNASNRDISQKMDINIALKGVENMMLRMRNSGDYSVNSLGRAFMTHNFGFRH